MKQDKDGCHAPSLSPGGIFIDEPLQHTGENILILISNYTELNATIKAICRTKTNARNLDPVDH